MSDNVSGQAPQAGEGGPESTPAMPAVTPGMLYPGTPDLLVTNDVRHSLGWQDHRRAGPSFVVVAMTWFGTRVKARFPLTQPGWESAWRALAAVDPDAAVVVAAKLARRAARDSAVAAVAALDQQSLCHLRRVTFKGGSGGEPLVKDHAYELRFLGDRATAGAPRQVEAALEIPYRDIEAVEVSGPGDVSKPLGELLALVLGLGLLGALLGVFIFGLLGLLLGAVLFGLIGALIGSASSKVETIVRIRSTDADLYFLATEKQPDGLRIDLAPVVAAIDAARAGPRDDAGAAGAADVPSASIPDQLGKLASLLEHGTITRDEFEHLKAKLITSF